jgi:hypothetical protein
MFAFESMRGGDLAATINLPGRPAIRRIPTRRRFHRVMTVRNFQLINQPLISRLFSAGSLRGLAI